MILVVKMVMTMVVRWAVQLVKLDDHWVETKVDQLVARLVWKAVQWTVKQRVIWLVAQKADLTELKLDDQSVAKLETVLAFLKVFLKGGYLDLHLVGLKDMR